MELKAAGEQEIELRPASSAVERAADLGRLFEEHAPFVRELLVRLVGPQGEVEDLLQETFLIAWRKEELFDGRVPARPWLYGIAVKVVSVARRRAKVRRWIGLSSALDVADRATPHSLFERAEASRLLYAALDRLSERKRTVFILYEIQGFTSMQIGLLLGCSPATVRTRLLNARLEVEGHLKEQRAGEQAGGSVP